jgi:group II intron reverse transcriptase/maturase/CRISPR-associated endonuclease Cas1
MTLYEQVCDETNLLTAWEHVKAGGKRGGIDDVSVAAAAEREQQLLSGLRRDLSERRYRPEPAQAVDIPKPSGGERHIGLPTVRDKVCQTAALQVIAPVLDRSFSPASYAYRPQKGPLRAVRRVMHAVRNEGMAWVCLADVDDFFDTLDADLLEPMLREVVVDHDVVDLVMLWVRMGSVGRSWQWVDRSSGVPQGAPISGLLSNLYLTGLDRFATAQCGSYVRYADNLLLMAREERQVQRALGAVQDTLRTGLHLRLNEGAVVRSVAGAFEFLGVVLSPSRVSLSEAKVEAMRRQAQDTLARGVSPSSLSDLADLTQGWSAYYGELVDQQARSTVDTAVFSVVRVALQGQGWRSCFTEARLLATLASLSFLSQEVRLNRVGTMRGLLNTATLAVPGSEPLRTRTPLRVAPPQPSPLPSKVPAPTPARPLPTVSTGTMSTAPPTVSAAAPVPPVNQDDKGYDVKRVVEQRKRQYQQRERSGSELLVSTPGSYVGVRDQMLYVTRQHTTVHRVPLRVLRHITVASAGVSLSSNLLMDCWRNEVGVDFVDRSGTSFARVQFEDDPSVRLALAQVDAQRSGTAGCIARSIVAGKIGNQMSLVRYFLKSRPRSNPIVSECLRRVELMGKLAAGVAELKQVDADLDTLRGKLLSIEGRSASLYWDCVTEIIGTSADFPGREGRGARDLVNSLLNYGYGILYGRVWQAVAQQGLTAGIGFMHVQQKGKPALVFDLIEEFRQEAVDHPVVAAVTRHLPLALDKGRLTDDTRKFVATQVLERLETPVRYHGTATPLAEVIVSQARLLRYVLLGAAPAYHTYHLKW